MVRLGTVLCNGITGGSSSLHCACHSQQVSGVSLSHLAEELMQVGELLHEQSWVEGGNTSPHPALGFHGRCLHMFGGGTEKRDDRQLLVVSERGAAGASPTWELSPAVGSACMIQDAPHLWVCRALWAQIGPSCLLTPCWLYSLGTLLEVCGFHLLSCKLEVGIPLRSAAVRIWRNSTENIWAHCQHIVSAQSWCTAPLHILSS